MIRKLVIAILFLSSALSFSQTKMPILNGILRSDLDANNFNITNLDVTNLPLQPLDSDLTSISSTGITSVGLDVISQPDLDSLQDYLQIGAGGGAIPVFNVVDYGAVADFQTLTDITTSNGSNTLDSASYTFVTGDIGKAVVLRGARRSSDSTTPFHGYITAISAGNAVIDQTVANWQDATLGSVRLDFGTDNVVEFNAAIADVPAQGGIVYVPPGKYFIGTTMNTVPSNHSVKINKNNLHFLGAGMGATQLYYNSAMHTTGGGGSYMNGQGISVGLTPSEATRTGVRLSDFSIEDRGWIEWFGGPSCINVLGVDNLRVHDVEMFNCKGNGAFAAVGDTITGTSRNIYLERNYIHGDDQGFDGFGLNGDGFNVGHYHNVHVKDNTIIKPGRHGYEGGGDSHYQFITNNYIDMQDGGTIGINPTDGNKTIVADNIILNIDELGGGIDFSVDVGIQWVAKDIVITGNYIDGDTDGGAGILFVNSSGDSTLTHIDRALVANNYIKTQVGVYVDDKMNLTVVNNVFEVANVPMQLIPTSLNSGQMIIFRGNRCTGTIDFGFHALAHSPQFIVDDNIFGQVNNGYGTTQSYNFNTTVNAGTINTQTVSYSGATPGLDEVVLIKGPTFPADLIVDSTITSNDTITFKFHNTTGGNITIPSENSLIRIRRGVNYVP